jgi:hypothetical protein
MKRSPSVFGRWEGRLAMGVSVPYRHDDVSGAGKLYEVTIRLAREKKGKILGGFSIFGHLDIRDQEATISLFQTMDSTAEATPWVCAPQASRFSLSGPVLLLISSTRRTS